MRGLSFLKCADALLDVKTKATPAGLQKFYDKAQEYIERANNMNKPETDKPGYKEWEEFCALIQVNWKFAPPSQRDHAAARLLLEESLGRVVPKRNERLETLSKLVDSDLFTGDVTTPVPTVDALTCAYFNLYHDALERAKGRRASVLAQMESNAELEALSE